MDMDPLRVEDVITQPVDTGHIVVETIDAGVIEMEPVAPIDPSRTVTLQPDHMEALREVNIVMKSMPPGHIDRKSLEVMKAMTSFESVKNSMNPGNVIRAPPVTMSLGNIVRTPVNQIPRGDGALSIRLKPCVVCGDKSTGYHFGVISCEACKSFYRRSLKRTNQYFCEKGGNCPSSARGNNSCPACRLKRCKLVGMSPDAVKKGRYSLEKRAETIIQSRMYWQNLQQQQEVSGGPINPPNSWNGSTTPQTVSTPAIATNRHGPAGYQYEQLFSHQESPHYINSVHVPYTVSSPSVSSTTVNEAWGTPASSIAQLVEGYEDFQVYSDGKLIPYPSGFKGKHAIVKQEYKPEEDTIPQEDSINYMHTIVDYSQLGSYAKDIVIDGINLGESLKTIVSSLCEICKTHQVQQPEKEKETKPTPVVKPTNSEVCQMQIDGLPVTELFRSLRPKTPPAPPTQLPQQANALRKPRKNVVQQYQNILKFYSPVQGGTSPETKLNKVPLKKPTQDESQRDLQETAEALINLANYPIDNKAKEQLTHPYNTGGTGNFPSVGEKAESAVPSSVLLQYIDTTSDLTTTEQELLVECVTSVDDCIDLEEIDRLIQTTYENVEKNKFISDEAAETIPEIQRRFLEQRTIREQMYGKIAPTSTEEYLQIYKTTGIDGPSPDKDANYMERIVQMFVQLYKSFPGYNNLPIDDQATLLKGTKEDVGYIMNIKLVNVKDRLLTSQFLDITYDMNYFTSFAPEETVLKTFLVAERVQNLDLNKVETAIASAFVAMQPDVCKTNEGRLLCQLQRKKTLKSLYKTLCMERTRENAIDIIKEIFAVLKLLKVQENSLSNQWDRFIQSCN